jgi:undecaprenyl-diphosphatase
VLRGVPASALERNLLCGMILASLGYLAMVWWIDPRPLSLDEAARAAVLGARHPALNSLMADVSRLGAPEGIIALIALGSACLWRGRRLWALALPAIMAGTGALQFLAKWSADRPRPDLQPWGFPSGHVLSLVVFFGMVAYLGWTSGRGRRRRGFTVFLCAIPVVLVAYSRMYLDRHWLTDLAGGLAVGLAYLLLALLVVEVARARRARPGAVAPLP